MSSRPGFPRLFGEYALLAPLAEPRADGVFLATSRALAGEGRACVMKVRRLAPGGRSPTIAELRPGIAAGVPVLDAGRLRDQAFVALEHVDGRDLFEVWARCARMQVPVPLSVATRVVLDLLEGLGALHAGGAVHGQVCPAKVLVGADGAARLGEAALRAMTQPAPPGTVVGRVGYFAPERLVDGRQGPSIDVYAAGVILWELLTGHVLWSRLLEKPPAGKSPVALIKELRAAVQRDPARPSALSPRAPAALDPVVLEALAVHPELRYPDARSFSDALERAGAPLAARSEVAAFLAELFAGELAEGRRELRSLVDKGRLLLGGAPLAAPSRSEAETQARVSPARAAASPEHPLRDLDEVPAGRKRWTAAGGPGGGSAQRAPSEAPGGREVRGSPGDAASPRSPAVVRRWPVLALVAAGAILGAAVITPFVLRSRGGPSASSTGAAASTSPGAAPSPPGAGAAPAGATVAPAAIPPTPPPATSPFPGAPEPAAPPAVVEPGAAAVEDAPRGEGRRPRRADRPRAGALLREAQDAYDRSSFSLAITKASLAARAGGGADAYNIVGDAFLALRDWPRAANAYRKALKADRRSESARVGLRKALSSQAEAQQER
jgi:serine/threonine-protein kinase